MTTTYDHDQAEQDEQDRIVRACTNTDKSYHCGDGTYPEGEHFCGYCGAQFDDPTHGVDVPCDHSGGSRIVRTAHGYLGDAPRGTRETLCGECGELLASDPPDSTNATRHHPASPEARRLDGYGDACRHCGEAITYVAAAQAWLDNDDGEADCPR